MDDWPFDDPPNTAALTTRDVLEGTSPILLVTHDADDGSWQFLPGRQLDPGEGRVVGLGRIYRHDNTLHEIADLPDGWQAWRDRPGAPWHRRPSMP